ncbi:glucose-1-phosphate thymidylyltransferase [candidate division KSB1 bacterium]|nr:glucose-1-phosphate thymidylyltransferase [candidate division KSB1 bacterium]RQW01065.1 MAG: glucose-1-phosphate thymidylyltransferase [candidate division KSB1 bacterium]
MKALITAGGKGTRLRPLTHTQNKHLLPIANKPILHYALEKMAHAGITEVGIITNQEGEEVKSAIGTGEQWGLHIVYIPQEAPLGLAHVVKISQDFIGDDPFIFYLGDNMVVGDLKKFIDVFEKDGSNCHLTLSKVKDPERFGVPELRNNRIISIEEKPQNPKSEFAVTGIYLYDSTIFKAVNSIKPSARGELEISDAHQYLLDNGYKISYSEITGWWKDTGKPEDVLEANRLILEHMEAYQKGMIDAASNVTGNVVVEEGANIINSVVRGPVVIGKNTIIENSFIGPFTSIGHNCTIRNSEVEFSIVLDRGEILDVGVRIEGSLLGTSARIVSSIGRPRSNRFVVGDQSLIEIR